MKKIYDASNSVEAYMVLNLLEQEGLNARIDGEYLQGGVGDLQALDLVRVMIDETDYEKGKKILEELDKKQPQKEKFIENKKSINSLLACLIGLIIGIAFTAFFYNTPIYKDRSDQNNDGKYDVTWKFRNDITSEIQMDRNFDENIDFIGKYNRKGIIKSSKSDNDFNGTFESSTHYKFGIAYSSSSDTNGDGFIDYKVKYKNEILDTITFFDRDTKKPRKIQYFETFKLKMAEEDTNKDGIVDIRYIYDDIENIIKTENIKPD